MHRCFEKQSACGFLKRKHFIFSLLVQLSEAHLGANFIQNYPLVFLPNQRVSLPLLPRVHAHFLRIIESLRNAKIWNNSSRHFGMNSILVRHRNRQQNVRVFKTPKNLTRGQLSKIMLPEIK